ncbi:DUF2188 domain-containing protein [Chryseolinea lacunae]|uniref:DUF2188 domain-containing protein n=1 Tax=Chryseolinea lacunae TaxID=2801331 RepID=A0ABS1KRA2_9BACT|nr:DUF2188 domain-containing protein [Chryseolinea lacunae]MBL0741969.1 DUF2188 domain-containing protein [Chryseolinea lacunae]
MPWTTSNYPDSMKNLPERVRDKAIDIANALLEERDMEEGIAIATGISRAKDWAANHDLKVDNPDTSNITDVKHHGEDRYVVPHEKEWAIKVEGEEKVEKIFRTKKDAVRQARREARSANASLTIQQKSGRVEKRISYNPRKRAAKATH